MPMGEILYLNSVGGFRKKKVKLDPTHPIVVKNHKDKQAHALDEKPVHSVLPPVRFDSFEELLEADAPKDPLIVSKWGIVCADNAVWPLSPQSLDQYLPLPRTAVFSDPDDQEGTLLAERGSLDDLRQLKYQEYIEEATQRAMHDAEKADSKDGYLTTINMILGMVACVVLLIIAAVIAWYKWGDPPKPPETAALLMLLPALGLVNLKERAAGLRSIISKPKTPKEPKIPKEPKAQKPKLAKGDAWVTATVFDHPLLGGKIWYAQMLYSLWVTVLPESCVFRPDIPRLRLLGAMLGAIVVGAPLFGVCAQFFGPIGGIGGIILFSPIGAGLGWLFGPMILGNKPKIMVARIPDDNNSRKLVPIEHNYCRTVSVGDYLDNLESVLEQLNAPGVDEDDVYEPTVFRATTFYDDLLAQDETAEVSAPNQTLQKVQIGVMALMAFGSIGLLFFVAMATTKPGV